MRKLMPLTIAAATLLAAGPAAAQSDGATLLTAKELRARVAKTEKGVAAVPLPIGATTVVAVHRTASGAPETHETIDDVYVVQEGHATVLVGGTLEGSHEISPGERREGKITGTFRRVAIAPGDILRIPANVPHQVVIEHGPVRYLAFKLPGGTK